MRGSLLGAVALMMLSCIPGKAEALSSPMDAALLGNTGELNSPAKSSKAEANEVFIDWQMESNSPGWRARSKAGVLVYDDKIWIMGGAVAPTEHVNDVWYTEDGVTWTEATGAAAWPVRAGHAVVVFDGAMWVIGGYELVGPSYYADAWYSTDGVSWTQATGTAEFGERWNFQASVIGDSIHVFGGRLVGGVSEAVYRSNDGVSWTLVTDSAPWGARELMAVAEFDGNLLMTGGRGNVSSSRGRDAWGTLDGDAWTPLTANAAWPARQSHAMVALADEAWILGGYTGSARLNDVWHSEDGVQWKRAVPANPPWVPRGDLDVVTWQDKLWVISGHNYVESTNTYYGDVWSGTLMPFQRHSADVDGDGSFSLSEILRVIQLYNSSEYSCEPESEDGFAPNDGDRECSPHNSDYAPEDWSISVSELLRVIQFYNIGAYLPCSESEDGFCAQGN